MCSYNGLRLAYALARQSDIHVRVFLIGDAAACARAGQKVPTGYYNIEQMVSSVVRRGGEAGVCGTCMDARGLSDDALCCGAHRSSMDELAAWAMSADKVLAF